MHNRNLYATTLVDYQRLIHAYPPLKKYVIGNRLSYKDPKAVRELNCALLYVDFGIRLEIPLDTLCPPVPNRLDYILHIEDLLEQKGIDSNGEIHGIDIGTGASCIYPLLGCSLHKNWSFSALDTHPRSIEFALQNVQLNKLDSRIHVKLNPNPKVLLPSAILSTPKYHFCMCNPPFFEDSDHVIKSQSRKELLPSGVCTGAEHEMITEGGEKLFIRKLIDESFEWKDRIMIFTSLVGIKDDLRVLESYLDEKGIKHSCTSFRQSITTRWILSWAF